MTTDPTSVQTSRSGSSLGSRPSVAGIADPAVADHESLSQDVSRLRLELASLKESLTRVASQAGGEAARTVRNVSQTVAAQVGGAASGAAEAGSDLAAAASEHAKTFASELEGMVRRNPLGTLAGALLVGVVIGMMARGRS